MNNVPKPFCPHCTADWDRPWYDICPSCGHRFKARPWWQSPWFILLLICLPALAIATFRVVTKLVPGLGGGSLESIALVIAMIGVPVGSVAAAVILPLRMEKKGAAVAGWTLVWLVVFGLASVSLCFFSCLFSY